MKKIGIIAGSGILPKYAVEKCQKLGIPYFVAALKNHTEAKYFENIPMHWFRLGAVGSLVKALKQNKVDTILFIGAVKRPSLLELWPDWFCLKFFLALKNQALGDNKLLTKVIEKTESLGFKVIGIDDLVPELLTPEGVLTIKKPTPADQADIAQGIQVAKLLGKADVGQAVIVQRGIVLSLEGVEGTKALIQRTKTLKKKGFGGTLVKMVKPKQETRIDLPTIGPETVIEIYKANLKGIALEKGKTLIADAQKTVDLANEYGIFIVGVSNAKS